MRTEFLIFALVLAASFGCAQQGSSPAPSSLPAPVATPAVSPTQVVERFRDVLRAEMVPTALFMIDELDYGSPSADQVRLRMKRLAEDMARGTYDFKPVDEHVLVDSAAVIVQENPTRSGPAQFAAFYLIRREGGWKLSPEPSNFDRFRSLSAVQATTFRDLDRWFQLRKADLKMEAREK